MTIVIILILILTVVGLGANAIIAKQRKQEKMFSFKSIFERLLLLIKRFPSTVIMLLTLSVLFFILISNLDSPPIRIWLFCIGGVFASITATLFAEEFFNHLKTNFIAVGAILLWGVYAFFLPEKESAIPTYKWIELVVINIAFFLAMFFVNFLGKNKDRAFWNFTSQMFWQLAVATVFGTIFFGGLSLAFLAIESLFNISIEGKTYSYLGVVCFVLLSPIYFLATIPYKTEKHNNNVTYNKIQQTLALYVLVPILAIYAVILYAYLVKIIVAWQLPNGWVSWLVSTLAFGGLLVIALLYPIRENENNKATNSISRWIILIILPLLTLMTVGIFRRIGDYGITINRGYILLLNIWFYGIYIYLLITKLRHIKWILISPVVIGVIASINLWGVAKITENALTHEVNIILKEKVSFKDAQNILNKLNERERKRMKSVFTYLFLNFGKESVQQFFTDKVSNSRWDFLEEINLELNNTTLKFIRYSSTKHNKVWKMNQYNTFREIAYHSYQNNDKIEGVRYHQIKNTIKISTADNTFLIPLKEITSKYFAVKEFGLRNEQDLVLKNKDYKVVIKHFYGKYFTQKDSIYINDLDGYLFYNRKE